MRSDEVIEETDTLRLGVMVDGSPEEPYDDGRTPIVEIRYGYARNRVQRAGLLAGGYTPAGLDRIIEVLESRRLPDELFDRYLRMFYGTRSILAVDGRDSRYLTFDTADWRAHNGFGPDDTPQVWLDDWMAYVNGEVYGWVIERMVTWTREGSDEQMHTWETVESVWGYYGHDDAESEARSAWSAYLEESSK